MKVTRLPRTRGGVKRTRRTFVSALQNSRANEGEMSMRDRIVRDPGARRIRRQ